MIVGFKPWTLTCSIKSSTRIMQKNGAQTSCGVILNLIPTINRTYELPAACRLITSIVR